MEKGGKFLLSNVKMRCAESGISIQKLERTLGFGNGTIARWEVSKPSIDRVKLVADYFGCTIDDLLKEE